MSGESTTTAAETAELAQNNGSDKIDTKDAEATGIESKILAAMRSRVTYLREKADSFTFESVRRLLEEDLGLEKYALDVHKSFVKQHLVQCLEDAGNDSNPESSQETEKKDDATEVKEVAKGSEEHEAKKDVKEDTTGDDEKMEDSPVMGLLTEEKTPKSETEQTTEEDKKEVLHSEIKEALRKRSSYIKANSEKITMALLRRLLEKDLKVEKFSLDPYKKFINEELDEVLQAPDAPKPKTEGKKKNSNPKVKSTTSKKSVSEENSGPDGEDDQENEEVGSKKKTAQKRKISKSEATGKRKREKENVTSAKKKAKQTDLQSESDAGDSEIISDDDRSQSSSEKTVKQKKETTPTAGYGKRVEQLKTIIKSCGMSVPPSIYRKAKQAPEDKREDTLVKELKQILAKEGLSLNPSEKEIKEVKKRKEIKKELEGIDTSNIVSSSRRRSSTSFVPPPKPKIAEESESDESEDSEDEEDEEEEEVGEEEGGGNEDPEEGSQSEEESNNGDEDDEENE